MHKSSRFIVSLGLAAVASFSLLVSGCGGPTGVTPGPKGSAATVNGKAITMEQVEKLLKQQGQGQEAKLSPLELAQARLQILDSLIQQEVMFQKAEKEKTIPTDEEVTTAYNEQKIRSNRSAEEIEKALKDMGETEASAKESIRKGLAIENLMKKITGKVDSPKDGDIENFYNSNKESFVKKRGVKLAAIVVDPANSGQGDTTVDEASARVKVTEIMQKLQQGGSAAFVEIAAQNSEDPSRVQGGEMDYMPEEALKQNFPQFAADFMNTKFAVGSITPAIPMFGKFYIFKLIERNEADEALTLEKPGTREQITNMLVTARKNLLQASYSTIAMNEAKIENLLAKQVVENPNELSAARPADAGGSPAANTAANTNPANAANTAANSASNAPANAANANAAGNSNAAANAPKANANK